MKSATSRHSGFAMVTAIVLLSLSAMAITLLGQTIYNQARRTQSLNDDAQFRQLLVAGETFAKMQAQSNSTGRFTVSLPDVLKQNAAELMIEIRPDSTDKKIAEINASLAHHQRFQQLTLLQQNGNWQVTEANLDK